MNQPPGQRKHKKHKKQKNRPGDTPTQDGANESGTDIHEKKHKKKKNDEDKERKKKKKEKKKKKQKHSPDHPGVTNSDITKLVI